MALSFLLRICKALHTPNRSVSLCLYCSRLVSDWCVCVIHERVCVCVSTCRDVGTNQKGRGAEGSFYKASNSSILCLVLPDRICLSVLYLSRPARTFSL